VTRRLKTVSAARAQAAHHLAQAEQFLDAARHAIANQRHDAGMLNAIHAGISAADAVTGRLGGRAFRRSRSPSSRDAAGGGGR